jgi:26S proteasome regulatory subunit N6
MAQGDSQQVQDAQKLVKTDPRKAEALYKDIISKPPSVTSEAAIKEYETALISLGELYRDEKCVCAMAQERNTWVGLS